MRVNEIETDWQVFTGEKICKTVLTLEVVEDEEKDEVLRLDPTVLDPDRGGGRKEKQRRRKETASHLRMDLVLPQQLELRLGTPCLASHCNVTLESLLQPSRYYCQYLELRQLRENLVSWNQHWDRVVGPLLLLVWSLPAPYLFWSQQITMFYVSQVQNIHKITECQVNIDCHVYFRSLLVCICNVSWPCSVLLLLVM